MFKQLKLDRPHYLLRSDFEDEFLKQTGNLKAWTVTNIGQSEQNNSIMAYSIGKGKRRLVFAAGHHSDEPLGPHTLRQLILQVDQWWDQDLNSKYTLDILPHVNPDGENINKAWINQTQQLKSFDTMPYRELPGRDMEFAYPDGRVENAHLSRFFREKGTNVPLFFLKTLNFVLFIEISKCKLL